MTSSTSDSGSREILASGGGHATAAGVGFEAQLGAIFACQLLAERPLDSRLGLGTAHIKSIRFETEAPVDDILIETDQTGYLFVQTKTTLTSGKKADSELGKTADQIVRLYLACERGAGKRGWDRPLRRDSDRVLLALGPPTAFTRNLSRGLVALQAAGAAPLPSAVQKALDTFVAHVRRAWTAVEGTAIDQDTLRAVLGHATILSFDVDGADRAAATAALEHVIENSSEAAGAFTALARYCEELMTKRLGADIAGFRHALAIANIALTAPPSFGADVEALRRYSERVQSHLSQYEETKVGETRVQIDRPCIEAVTDGALDGSLLLVGDPGAGKSAVLSTAATRLKTSGYDVIELAVDRLPVESLEGLRSELGLSHSLTDVLINWPGDKPAFFFIDALDATRGGPSEAVFRVLISDVLALPGGRWRIIASIRTFDLRLGQQFRDLFQGVAPDLEFAAKSFSDVRHVHVPSWSENELGQVRAQARQIDTALQAGGQRLHDLALVPFNTRLLADLISDGLAPAAFGEISTQVELLDLYWRHRILKHGSSAEICLNAALSDMIAARALRARKLEVAKAGPAALDQLLGENVLILMENDQFIGFRHHILFDYAASRLYLRPDDLEQTATLLQGTQGVGFLLAPALAFALERLWADSRDGRTRFWNAVIRIAGDPQCDPIARSVAARTASELPRTAEDTGGLIKGLSDQDIHKSRAARAFGHVIGSIAVRLEDKQSVAVAPWCELAAQAVPYVEAVLYPLRTLLFLLVERIDSETQRDQLGCAARAILEFALDHPTTSAQLTATAIDSVAATYGSDIQASRDLLRRLLEPARFRDHADQDLPWLSGKMTPIVRADPDFAIEIYKVVFGRDISDQSSTSIGNSKILPLSSNRRQDYGMARFNLKEFFPRFLQTHPRHATTAMIRAIDGYIDRRHPNREGTRSWTVPHARRQAVLIEDHSHIWAWNPNEEHGSNTLGLLKAYVTRLHGAPRDVAREIVEHIIDHNQHAVIWARTLLVAAQRPADIGDLLWPFVTQQPFLRSADVSKDTIDFVAARYPFQSVDARVALERAALSFTFDDSTDPNRSRQSLLATLFGRIGMEQLATDEARRLVPAGMSAAEAAARNQRPYQITTIEGPPRSYWWLREAGVDVTASENASLLSTIEQVKASLGMDDARSPMADLPTAIARLKHLFDVTVRTSAGAAQSVIEYAHGAISEGAAKIAGLSVDQLKENDDAVLGLVPLLDDLTTLPFPEVGEETEADFENSPSWGSPSPRVDAARAIMGLLRLGPPYVDHFRATVDRVLDDSHPAVRLQIAERLTCLWTTDRPWMWQLARRVAEHERNRSVLGFFANHFIGQVIHHGVEEAEQLTLLLRTRDFPREEKASENLLEQIGSLIALLWIGHGREPARRTLEEWLADAPRFEPELGHAIDVSRDPLVLGYTTERQRDRDITRRAQQFAAWAVQATAGGLEHYLQSVAGRIPSEEEKTRATMFAKLLNNIADELYFASGAFNGSHGGAAALTTDDAKRAFLDDTYPILCRIADVGTPGTIHHLIELFEFLIPADPARVFDLVAHALLGAGRRHGYQFESLGADRFVAVIGRFLADYRPLFADEQRRQLLIACLEAFMEAGWPAARRLLYRLPELLQ
jgi:hypothetical protein